jgi:hypothetical protein
MDFFGVLAGRALGTVPLLMPRSLSRFSLDAGATPAPIIGDDGEMTADVGMTAGAPRRVASRVAARHTSHTEMARSGESIGIERAAGETVFVGNATSSVETPMLADAPARTAQPGSRPLDAAVAAASPRARIVAHADVEHAMGDDVATSSASILGTPAFPAYSETADAVSDAPRMDALRARERLLVTHVERIDSVSAEMSLEEPAMSRVPARAEPLLVPRGPVPVQSLMPAHSSASRVAGNSIATSPSDSQPVVEVTIGRVEVRAVTPPASPVRREAAPARRVSLDEYMKRRPGT